MSDLFFFSLNLKINDTDTPNDWITYSDFLIRTEYNFIQNIIDKYDLEQSKTLNLLETYYSIFKKFIFVTNIIESSSSKSVHLFPDENECFSEFLREKFENI